jgi:hypothetical protein
VNLTSIRLFSIATQTYLFIREPQTFIRGIEILISAGKVFLDVYALGEKENFKS